MAEPQKFQRRTVLIKRGLQLKFASMVFLSALLAALIAGADIYYSMAHIIMRENPAALALATQFNTLIVFKILLFLAIMIFVSFYVSHRFAGPIYRFEQSAQEVSTGDLTHRVSLRTGDELLELQEEFNGMLASLQTLVAKDRALAAHLEQRLASISQKAADATLRGELDALKTELATLTKSFKV